MVYNREQIGIGDVMVAIVFARVPWVAAKASENLGMPPLLCASLWNK